jgi:hypothetical protein
MILDLWVWDVITGRVIVKLAGHDDTVDSCAW